MMTSTQTLSLPDAPSIDGLAFRHFRSAEDYAAMAALSRDASLHDGNDEIPDAESMQVDFENTTDLVPSRDVTIAEVAGRPVAWSYAMRQVRDGLATYISGGSVHPDWRRRGIGRALLRANEAHSRERAKAFDDPGGRVLGAWCADVEVGARDLLAAEGYVAVRWFFEMIRRSLDDIPDAPLPPGIEIRDVRQEDLRRIFEADNEAFRDHWGHREQTEEDFRRTHAMPYTDTSLWSVAWDGDEVVGSATPIIWKPENEALGVRRGWIEHVSVRRPWRRRGVATALIADAMRRLRDAGMDAALLGVDADNPTGALALYEGLGFEVKDRAATYRKPWEPGGRLV